MKYHKKKIGILLAGTFKGKSCRLAIECYAKTAEIKVTLFPVDGSAPIVLTQNLGQPMPLYQAFLSDGILDVGNTDFMDYAERNGLGYIADIKRYDIDVLSGRPRKTTAVFQFNKTALRKVHPLGCARYEWYEHRLKCRAPYKPYTAISA